MTITFRIQNVLSEEVKTVMLRKYFQMVFVGTDRKSLDIYTATIIGASKEEYSEEDLQKKKNFVSQLGEIPEFRLLFDYTISGNETNEVTSIKHEDITDCSKDGLFSQIEHLKKVWGDACTIVYNNQKLLQEKLDDLTQGLNKEDLKIKDISKFAKIKTLFVDESKKPFYGHFLKSLAIQGKCITGIDYQDEPSNRRDYTKRSIYAIDVPKEGIPDGVELVNWIRTTISFSDLIDDKEFNYSVQKPFNRQKNQENKDSKESHEEADSKQKTTYQFLCPDFTWYFSPPIKTYIDNRNATVEIKRFQAADNCRGCECRYKEKGRLKNTSNKYHDGFGAVPNKRTVEFNYWVKNEKIKSRQKYRFAAKDISLGAEEFSDISDIMICLDMTDNHSRGNRQYIMGLFISFALGFGIDSTRIRSVEQYFPNILRFQADFLWVVFLILFSLTMLSKPPKVNDKLDALAAKVRSVSMIVSAFWFFAVFAVSQNGFVKEYLDIYHSYCAVAAKWVYNGILFVEAVYIGYLKVRHKDRILAGLFGEDIL